MSKHDDSEPPMDYNPRSIDSSFAKLFTRLDGQDAALARIEGKVDVQGDKVVKLERERWLHRGFSTSGVLAAAHHVFIQMLGK